MHPRYIGAVGAGSTMTLALLYLMQALMAGEPGVPDPNPHRPIMLSTVTLPPPRPPSQGGSGATWQPERPALPPGIPAPPAFRDPAQQLPAYDGPLVLVSRPLPGYPTEAVLRDLDGWVVVQFDVLANGRVANVSVVESSDRLFERSAIQAAGKYRFKPRVVDGVPQASPGLRNRIVYRMDRG